MNIKSVIMNYWRVGLAIVLVIGSLALLFGVTTGSNTSDSQLTDAETSQMTTLTYGLELAGGTRITAPLHGYTAEEVDITDLSNQASIERSVASHLENVPNRDVSLVISQDNQGNQVSYIEVTSESVTQEGLESALDEENISYETVREGVTEDTRERTVEVINNKINESGLSGGSARSVRSATGEYFILIEVPGEGRSNVRSVLEDRGSVQIDIYYPTAAEDGGITYETESGVLIDDSFQRVGTATENSQLGPHVPVTLTASAATEFRNETQNSGMVPGGSRCRYDETPEQTEPCLLTRVDGEVVYSAGMSPDLAGSIDSGDWTNAPNFVLQTNSIEEAQELSLHLSAGALPTGLDLESGSSAFISPAQGEQFQISSLIIAVLAILGVGGKVYIKYRDLRIVAPMLVTSAFEIISLLGFAALVGYPIDLAVVAGFVAVIGTGVDDLIIVTNEILSKGEINSKTVFDDRYSKAYWIVLAAAGTTAVALSPLIVLSLGQLQGFAIFTIVGILIGVFITRPAYADILSYLFTDRSESYNS